MAGDPDLEALSASVRKSLHWCAFLLAAMIVILAVDLQIKKSLGRQAVATARRLAQLDASLAAETDRLIDGVRERMADERGTVDAPADDGDHPGRGGGGDVDGGPGVAAGNDQEAGSRQAARARRPAGRVKRAPGDGRRAPGADG